MKFSRQKGTGGKVKRAKIPSEKKMTEKPEPSITWSTRLEGKKEGNR